MAGTLYIVATPIGNLGDISERARQVLKSVAVVAAEDTRHTGQLLAHYGLSVPLVAVHEHNESERVTALIARLQAGEEVALVTDAGTPLVSDPGYRLVAAAASVGVRVTPIPGACAAIAALSVAGLPTDRFTFEGFLPQKAAARRSRLQALADESRTQVFYESPHRLKEALDDLRAVYGDTREIAVARELTKLHETIYRGTLAEIVAIAEGDANLSRGELVLVVSGKPESTEIQGISGHDDTLRKLLAHAPVSVIADAVAALTGLRRNAVYERALQLRREDDTEA